MQVTSFKFSNLNFIAPPINLNSLLLFYIYLSKINQIIYQEFSASLTTGLILPFLNKFFNKKVACQKLNLNYYLVAPAPPPMDPMRLWAAEAIPVAPPIPAVLAIPAPPMAPAMPAPRLPKANKFNNLAYSDLIRAIKVVCNFYKRNHAQW